MISASNATPEQLAERNQLVQSVSTGRHIRASNSGHWIQFDEPELVVQAVRELVKQS